jgi:hypothetical protein
MDLEGEDKIVSVALVEAAVSEETNGSGGSDAQG